MSKAKTARCIHVALTVGILLLLAMLALREPKILEVLGFLAACGALTLLVAHLLSWSITRHERRSETRGERLAECLYRKPPKEFR